MKIYHVEFQRNGHLLMSMTVEALSPMGAITYATLPPNLRHEGKDKTLAADDGQWTAEKIPKRKGAAMR